MPDLELMPRQRRGHHLQEVDGEHILFGRAQAKALFLNESASIVWKLCDGTRTVRQIIEELKEAFPESSADIEGDVAQTLDHLVSEGVLALNEPSTGQSA